MSKIVKRSTLDLDKQIELEQSVQSAAPAMSGKVISKDVQQASVQAHDLLRQAQMQAIEIKKEAQNILKRVHEEREKAIKKGFDEGRQEGLTSVSEMIAQAAHQKEVIFEGLERNMLKLVYDICEKIIG